VDRRHLLKALFAGLTLAGISVPAFSAAKDERHQGQAGGEDGEGHPGSRQHQGNRQRHQDSQRQDDQQHQDCDENHHAFQHEDCAVRQGREDLRADSDGQSKGSAKGGRPTSVARGGRRQRDEDDGYVTRIDTNVSPGLVRSVSLDIVNTGEKGRNIVYFENGQYQADALFELNLLLRDWRADKVRAIDPKVFDTLYNAAEDDGTYRPFEVVSAYRSPLTNFTLLLEGDGTGVARRSLHMDGRRSTSRRRGYTSHTSTRRLCSCPGAGSATTRAAASSTWIRATCAAGAPDGLIGAAHRGKNVAPTWRRPAPPG